MYRRYGPRQGMQPPKQGKPPAGEMGHQKQNAPRQNGNGNARNSSGQGQTQRTGNSFGQGQSQRMGHPSGQGQSQRMGHPSGKEQRPGKMPQKAPEEKPQASSNPLLGLLPPAVYNPETKKIFGLFSAEDLLLAALIFILADSEDFEDSILVYLLLYILISDYIELPF